MKKYTAFMFSCLILFCIGCREDELISTELPMVNPITPVMEFFDTQINGIVLDTQGNIIENVTITTAGNTAETDDNGFFSLDNVSAADNGLYIKAYKDGFFVGGTHYFPREATTTQVTITLQEKAIETFMATNGGTFQTINGAEVVIPANAVMLGDQAYTGEVRISTLWLNPSEQSTFDVMPGALLGQSAEGQEQVLQSFGMIAVDMETPRGELLQLDPASTATLTFPLDNNLASNADPEIPLWHFDENNGYWVEEGIATRSGQTYVAEVNHFSWWNCDVPFDLTKLCIDIIDTDGNAIENLTTTLSYQGLTSFNSNSSCGLIPEDEVFTLTILDPCDNVILTQQIGPYSGGLIQTHTETITVNNINTITVSGNVLDCDNNPAQNVLVEIRLNNTRLFDSNANGSDYTFNLVSCSASDSITVTGIDLDARELGISTFAVDPNVLDYMTDIQACGSVFATEGLILTSNTNTFIATNVSAYSTAAETLIVASSQDSLSTGILVGFRGFGIGTFNGNIIASGQDSGADRGLVDQATINITRYDNVGGIIEGTVSEGDIVGTFTARRER